MKTDKEKFRKTFTNKIDKFKSEKISSELIEELAQEAYETLKREKRKGSSLEEKLIAKSAIYSFKYAQKILGDRFLSGEDIISKDKYILEDYNKWLETLNKLTDENKEKFRNFYK